MLANFLILILRSLWHIFWAHIFYFMRERCNISISKVHYGFILFFKLIPLKYIAIWIIKKLKMLNMTLNFKFIYILKKLNCNCKSCKNKFHPQNDYGQNCLIYKIAFMQICKAWILHNPFHNMIKGAILV
jgi:hypothetical protein